MKKLFTLAKPTGKMRKVFNVFVQASQGCVLDFVLKGEVVHMLQDMFVLFLQRLFPASNNLESQPSKLLSVKLTLDSEQQQQQASWD